MIWRLLIHCTLVKHLQYLGSVLILHKAEGTALVYLCSNPKPLVSHSPQHACLHVPRGLFEFVIAVTLLQQMSALLFLVANNLHLPLYGFLNCFAFGVLQQNTA